MKKIFFLAATGLSLSLLSHHCSAQEFKIRELEGYLQQSRSQVAAAFKSKQFVFQETDEVIESFKKGGVNASYMFTPENKIKIVSWSESATVRPKIIAELKASDYVLTKVIDNGGPVGNIFVNTAKGLKVVLTLIPMTQKVHVMVSKNQ
ncbi:hypothetical protein [Chitinophaga varians]|uniref:hypothetical protein n=1 Tax=Chitinophaga varians TaxID=2202339 RepID=UPI00165FD5FE|nr:hypothetical protein [Chitinophaga varians]MBC9909024.1 hypothetical protein [Chitinophaga varians]